MKLHHRSTVENDTPLVEYLHDRTGLSRVRIKRALTAGALTLTRSLSGGRNGPPTRVRRQQHVLRRGDRVDFHFDDNALTPPPEMPFVLYETPRYGLWFKPVNVLSQASPSGDLCCMDRLVERIRQVPAPHMINRLDREASGILLMAYDRKSAAPLSALWRSLAVEKRYQIEVLGQPDPGCGTYEFAIDGKSAVTRYEILTPATERTWFVEAVLVTGRHHQIRRHFATAGYPVMGDPKYGRHNTDARGLRLVSTEVRFICPFQKTEIHVTVPPERRLF